MDQEKLGIDLIGIFLWNSGGVLEVRPSIKGAHPIKAQSRCLSTYFFYLNKCLCNYLIANEICHANEDMI